MKTKYLLGAALAAFVSTASLAQVQQVSAQRLSDITKTLGSDAFEGRGPPREPKKTVAYIIDQFKAAGGPARRRPGRRSAPVDSERPVAQVRHHRNMDSAPRARSASRSA